MAHEYSHYMMFRNNCDPDDPLPSETPFGSYLKEIYLDRIKPYVLKDLFDSLNVEQLVPNEHGLARDYRGLAELMGYKQNELESHFKKSKNPAMLLIEEFTVKNRSSNRPTVNDLLKMLEKLERFDLIDDCIPTLIELIRAHGRDIEKFVDPGINKHTIKNNGGPLLTEAVDQLTIDDDEDSAAIYDAFICYAPEDIGHAISLISILTANGLSVTTSDKLLPGLFEFDAMAKVIDSRCRKVIIILTSNFPHSRECEFQAKFASELGIQADRPKIIPVIFERCDFNQLPHIIKISSKIDLSNPHVSTWQLHRLILSLKYRGNGMFSKQHEQSRLEPSREPVPRIDHIQFNSDMVGTSTASQNSSQLPGLGELSRKESPDPIIELMRSQNSTDMSTARSSSGASTPLDRTLRDDSNTTSHNRTDSGPLKWLRQIVRRKRADESLSETSRSNLITSSADVSVDQIDEYHS